LEYPNYEFFIEVVDVICEYVGGDPYGQLSSGKMVIKGKLEACAVNSSPFSPRSWEITGPCGVALGSSRYRFSTDALMSDLENDLMLYSKLLVLKTTKSKRGGYWDRHVVLQRVHPESEIYRRVGILKLATSDCADWFTNDAQTIAIQ
jgi:hypothetical protein